MANVSGEKLRSGETQSCGCLKYENRTVDMIGQKFGRLTVLERAFPEKRTKGAYYLCCCECDMESIVKGRSLRSGHTKSCGCYVRDQAKKAGHNNAQELSGQLFGRLTVLYRVQMETSGDVIWHCRCNCGNEVDVRGNSLRRGDTQSCGCLQRERRIEASVTHGGRRTRLYRTWCSMKSRCNNPNVKSYKDYGGRGIKVCPEWERDFTVFRDWAMSNGYHENLSIDRIDNDKGYGPDNCRWATAKEQAKNRRTTKRKN